MDPTLGVWACGRMGVQAVTTCRCSRLQQDLEGAARLRGCWKAWRLLEGLEAAAQTTSVAQATFCGRRRDALEICLAGENKFPREKGN